MRSRMRVHVGAIAVATAMAFVGMTSPAQADPLEANINPAHYPFMPLDPYDTGVGLNFVPTPAFNNDGPGPNGCCDLYDAYNLIAGTSLIGNDELDQYFIAPDHPWQLADPNFHGAVVLIGLTAGNRNTIGYYTNPNGSGQTPLLGPNSGFELLDPLRGTSFDVDGPFGFYLQTVGSPGNTVRTFYSDPTLNVYNHYTPQNTGPWDHMISYSLAHLANTTIEFNHVGAGLLSHTLTSNAVLIGWEDLPYNMPGYIPFGLGDEDYDDMIYLFDYIRPVSVPEPGTLLLATLGLGLVGIGANRFKPTEH